MLKEEKQKTTGEETVQHNADDVIKRTVTLSTKSTTNPSRKQKCREQSVLEEN